MSAVAMRLDDRMADRVSLLRQGMTTWMFLLPAVIFFDAVRGRGR